MKEAAQSANYEYGADIVDIVGRYSPFGHWNETVVIEKNQLEASLQSIEAELKKLAMKLGART